ncbi:MAG: hypothetical protein RLZZ312_868 [Bacteroidota bacterium]|jgi:phosphopantetheinyl transferase (holo-ACP synthase)
MIGNDIVDLQLARTQSNWQRPRFLEKVCSKNEIEYIQNSINQELAFWKIWTIKESAYKIWNRKSKITVFNPKYFECFDLDLPISKVKIDNHSFVSKTNFDGITVHSFVLKNKKMFDNIVLLHNRNNIQKKNNRPFYFENNIKNINISISNHGRFEKIILLKP